MFSVSATNWVILPCFMYGVRSENFCVLGFSVGSNFLAACMSAPFELFFTLVVNAVDLQVIKINHIASYDFVDDRFGQMAKLVGDDLARVRPGRRGVRIVARPHEIILTEPVHHAAAARIAKEGREYLIFDVFAR